MGSVSVLLATSDHVSGLLLFVSRRQLPVIRQLLNIVHQAV